ncbi:MAG: hypothetical protein IT175_12170 [Acidobacteria bacterium]|nr:hypothetical protein [Acidobacteriota bacterium]
MSLVELLNVLDSAYARESEGLCRLEGFFDPATGREVADAIGDTLAVFVVREVNDLCDTDGVDAEGVQQALFRAAEDLYAMARAAGDHIR